MVLGDINVEISPFLNPLRVRFANSTSQKIINIKINSEIQNKKRRGIILTFDDVTELVSAQKKAAWSNVARYLAHEIRNPLTPIKISAQRLQKNFLKNLLNNSTLLTLRECQPLFSKRRIFIKLLNKKLILSR